MGVLSVGRCAGSARSLSSLFWLFTFPGARFPAGLLPKLKRHRIKSRERYQKIKTGEHAVGRPFRLTCKCCGKEFESRRSNTLFCGPNCRAKFYRQEAAEIRKRECVCENCGKTFTTTRNNAKYCCDECRTQANRKMQKERNAAKKAASAVPVLQTGKSSEKAEQKTA